MRREARSREAPLRFLAPGEGAFEEIARLDEISGYALKKGRPAHLRTFYFDTPTFALARYGIGLRLQRNGARWEACAELGDRIGEQAGEAPSPALLDVAPRPPFTLPPGPLRLALRAFIAGRQLTPILVTDVERRERGVENGKRSKKGPLATLCLDAVRLESPDTRFARTDFEVSLEPGCADRAGLAAWARGLRRRHQLRPLPSSAFRRGIEFLYGKYLIESLDGETLTGGDSTGAATRKIVSRHLRRLRERDPGTRNGTDPEDLHRMRVASRRLRACLKTFSPAVPRGWRKSVRGELRWLGQLLGTVRDLDVQLARFERTAAGLSPVHRGQLGAFKAFMEGERERRREPMRGGLDSSRYDELLVQLELFTLDRIGTLPAAASEPAAQLGRKVLQQDIEAFWKHGGKMCKRSSPAGLHALRIEAKRLRYTLEFLRDLTGGPGRRLVKRLVRLQDTLGVYNDAIVAAHFIQAYLDGAGAKSSRRQVSALRNLVQEEESRAEKARARFGRAWNRFSDRHSQNDLRATLRTLRSLEAASRSRHTP